MAAPVGAQQIYKCVTKGGVEYQSMPCTNGEAEKTWNVEKAWPAPRPAPVYRNGGRGGQLHHVSQHKDAKACEAARAERERVFRAYGTNRRFDIGRRMNDMVWRACK
ncbi:DUF4124 domain-containing protein [Stenotrophomonas geniculata]|uniref:DUF4124 domain-containing protein n=1 Tax=Stenotrophomonas geniculata TaxID=86188 RepID=UPI0037536314